MVIWRAIGHIMTSIEYSLTTILGHVCDGIYNFLIDVIHAYLEGSVCVYGGKVESLSFAGYTLYLHKKTNVAIILHSKNKWITLI